MPTTAFPTTRRTVSSEPRAFTVPVVRELPRPAVDHRDFTAMW
jgi:hypothetical protein